MSFGADRKHFAMDVKRYYTGRREEKKEKEKRKKTQKEQQTNKETNKKTNPLPQNNNNNKHKQKTTWLPSSRVLTPSGQ